MKKLSIFAAVAATITLAAIYQPHRAWAGAVQWDKLCKDAQAAANNKDYDRAIELYKEALAEAESSNLEEGLQAKTVNDLALVYDQQGKPEQAEAYLKDAIAIKEKKFGPNCAEMAPNLNNLARHYIKQGKPELALEQLERSRSIIEAKKGPESSDLAPVLNMQAKIYTETHNYGQAEQALRRTVALTKAMNSRSAQIVALNNLATVLRNQGKTQEAEEILKQSGEVTDQSVAAGDANAAHNKAASLTKLAAAKREQGKFEEAEPLLKEAETMLGKEYTSSKTSEAAAAYIIGIDNLAMVYRELGNYPFAEAQYANAIEIEKQSGGDPIRLGHRRTNLAEVYMIEGKYAEAEKILLDVVSSYEKVQGTEGRDVAVALSNLQECYRQQGKFAEAQKDLVRAYDIKKKSFGDNSPELASTAEDLGLLLQQSSKAGEAETYFKETIKIRDNGKDSPELANALNNLARIYKDEGKYTEAEALYKRTLAMREKILGPQDPAIAVVLRNYASVLKELNRLDEAKALNKRARLIEDAN